MLVAGGSLPCLLRNKVCIVSFERDACSAYIVKRRYVWKLPGVDGDRKVAGDVRAQSRRNHGWSSRPEMAEGLEVGRKSCPKRHDRCWGVLRSALLAVVLD